MLIMTIHADHSEAATFSDAISARLKTNSEMWVTEPNYVSFNRDLVIAHAHDIHRAVTDVTGTNNYQNIDYALEQTKQFTHRAFDTFDSTVKPDDKFDWVFAIPARTTRSQTNEYASEITPFLPIVDPIFGVDAEIRQRTIVGLVPSIIDEYRGDDERRGALLYVPIHDDMRGVYPSTREFLDAVQYNMNVTAKFVHERLGAKAMGLGVIIPTLTNFGNAIHQEGLKTTTGHGGTIHIAAETTAAFSEYVNNSNRIGLIGAAGSIGRAAVDYLLTEDDQRSMLLYDTSSTINRLVHDEIWEGRTEVALSARQVLESTDIIISAVTDSVDLDTLDPEGTLDLRGKVIIDDSQPAYFDRRQVEARGGILAWVVGQDNTQRHALTRVKGYNYGDTAGLSGSSAVWGCEAEVAAIALTERYDLAITNRIKVENVRAIGKLCVELGISAARPTQSFGRLNPIV